jgi:galactose-1-phosphate uridylyltransferase
MYRPRAITKAYLRDPKHNLAPDDTEQCPFCALDDRDIHVDGPSMRVMANRFPYSYWDGGNVVEHLLLVPKRHVLSLAELQDDEKLEAISLMAEYEADGYSVYWRNQTSSSRSIPHQHTHLFKLGDKRLSLLLYLWRPYFLRLWWHSKNK